MFKKLIIFLLIILTLVSFVTAEFVFYNSSYSPEFPALEENVTFNITISDESNLYEYIFSYYNYTEWINETYLTYYDQQISSLQHYYNLNSNIDDSVGSEFVSSLNDGASYSTDYPVFNTQGNGSNASIDGDGASDYLRLNGTFNHMTSDPSVLENLTVSFWASFDSFNGGGTSEDRIFRIFMDNNLGADAGYLFVDNSGTTVEVNIRDSSGSPNHGEGTNYEYSFSTGTWYHFVYRLADNNVSAWVNGAYLGGVTGPTGLNLSRASGMTFLGYGSALDVDGRVDDIRIYNDALTAEQISTLYNNGNLNTTIYTNETTASITKQMPTNGTTFNWTWYATDSLGNLGQSDIYSLNLSIEIVSGIVNVTPSTPYNLDNLTCIFNITYETSLDNSVDINWFKNDVANTTYDVTYTNVSNSTIYTTTIGNGSIPSPLYSGDVWQCQIIFNGDSKTETFYSNNVTILNGIPDTPTINIPSDNTIVDKYNTTINFLRGNANYGSTYNITLAISNSTNTYLLNVNQTTEQYLTCTDETANETQGCGNGLGNYSFSGTCYPTWCGSVINTGIDGDYSTGAGTGISNGEAIITINYNKPSDKISAIWQVKDGIGTRNLTISDTCFNAYEGQLTLEVRYYQSGIAVQSRSTYYCYNGSDYQYIYQANGSAAQSFYEETIFWNNYTTENYLLDTSVYASGSYDLDMYACNDYTCSSNSSVSNMTINSLPYINLLYILPTPLYNNDTIGATSNVTDVNGQLMSYDYIWFNNNISVKSGQVINESNYLFNIDNLDSSYLSVYDSIIFSARPFDGLNYGDWFNTSILNVENRPLQNLQIYSPANNTESNQPLNVTFSVEDEDEGIVCYLNTNYSSVPNTGICEQGLANESYCGGLNKEYDFSNAYNDEDVDTYVTISGTGNYSANYSIPIETQNAFYNVKGASCGSLGCDTPFSNNYYETNLTIPNACLSQDILQFRTHYRQGTVDCNRQQVDFYCANSTGWSLMGSSGDCDVIGSEYLRDEAVIWNLTTYNSGENNSLITTPPADGIYTWNLSCTANGNSTPLYSGNYIYTYDGNPPVLSDYEQYNTSLFPQIGDLFPMNVSVADSFLVDTCKLMLNDTGTWENKSTFFINASSDKIETTYEIQNYSVAGQDELAWTFWCNDSAGNNIIGDYQSFSVSDVTLPLITQTANVNNNSIISGALYDISFNYTFFDYNLFQAMINVTCDINGTIYYWEILDINETTYNKADTFSLDGYPPQICTFLSAASDDHTQKEWKLDKDKEKKLTEGIEFDTPEKINIKITTKENKNKVKDKDKKVKKVKGKELKQKVKKVKTTKEKDRVKFKFELEEPTSEVVFDLETDQKLYFRPNSGYDAHFVAWNEDTKSGNWIDYMSNMTEIESYTVNKINDYHYEIKITFTEEVTEIFLESLGGTNVENSSFDFYIGGAINVSGLNIYDNTSFGDFYVDITTIDSYPGLNTTQYISGTHDWVENISNGTYEFAFRAPGRYFNQTYIVNVTNITQERPYETYESIVRIFFKNIKTNTGIENVNSTINNSYTNFISSYNSGNNNYQEMYINSSFYHYSGNSSSFLTYVNNFSVNTLQEKNITYYFSVYSSFILFDEVTEGVFNVSGADSINFLLFCDDETISTPITSSTQVIPITCDYNKFKFVLDYGSESYYRTFIYDDNEIFNVSIYLIDLLTTQSIYNSFIVDDLLETYDNPSIFIKKQIGEDAAIITSDYIDVENKVGAYLVQNHEYIIEIHSDNNPINILGNYAADLAGQKNLRLYDIGLVPEATGFSTYVRTSLSMQNISNTPYIVGSYEDTSNNTDSLTITLYEDNTNGTVLFSETYENITAVDITWNASAYQNSTIVGTMDINYGTQNYQYGKILQSVTEIGLGISEYVGSGFLNWFFTLLLGLLALMATIRTSNIMSIVLVGMASLFTIFGWFGISWSILILATLISLLSFLKSEEKLS